VIVIDHEMLANKLKNLLRDQANSLHIIEVPKSGGVQAMKYDEKAMQERYRDAFATPGQSAAHLYENL
jgi:hypothetical protein